MRLTLPIRAKDWRSWGYGAALAAMLRSLSGCERLILVCQRLGSVVALDIAERSAIDGIALLAPTISGPCLSTRIDRVGRKMIDEGMGFTETQRRTEEASPLPACRCRTSSPPQSRNSPDDAYQGQRADYLVLARPGRPTRRRFRCASRNPLPACVSNAAPVDGCDELVSNPTIATMPLEAGPEKYLIGQSRSQRSPRDAHRANFPGARPGAGLIGDGFARRHCASGSINALFGILWVNPQATARVRRHCS